MIWGGGSASTGCQCFCTSGSDKELETVRLASCSLPPLRLRPAIQAQLI